MSTTILYVEDTPQNMRLVRKMLAAEGFQMLEAADGLTGVQVAATAIPDLILMDINLPDIDGMEATARIRSNPHTEHIPIIALTANAMAGDRERFLDAGCNGYIAKPFSKTELICAVTHFLQHAAV